MILTVAIGTFLGNLALMVLLALLSVWADYQKEKIATKKAIRIQDVLLAERERMEKYAKMEG